MPSIFREEALEHHARGARPGEPLRLGDRRARLVLPLLFLALAVAVAAALVIRVPDPAGGTRTVAGALLGRP